VIASRKLLDAWLPPEGAGRAVACLATSYTFDPDFFEADCLARFLGLDWKRGEGDDLGFLIEQEERLAEARVSVLVDRGYNPESRSLRWDILPIGVGGGVLHPKVALLVWENAARVIVGSANLTAAAYRSQLECAVVLDAVKGGDLTRDLFQDLLRTLRQVVVRAAGVQTQPGPKQRAIETVADAARRVTRFQLPTRHRGRLRVGAVTAPGAVIPQLSAVWQGGPPRRATVLSPYFDSTEGDSRAMVALGNQLARRGKAEVSIVVQVETIEARTLVRAPRSLLESLPSRIRTEIYALDVPSDDLRRLHAKVIVLESEDWTAALVGSSNFTAAGLGLVGNAGNVEIGLALGAPARSREAEALRSLIPTGDEIEIDAVEWVPEPDDETGELEIPGGFLECLLQPGTPPVLRLRLDPARLPEQWLVRAPEGTAVVDSEEWNAAGRPSELPAPLTAGRTPFFVEVEWSDSTGHHAAGWLVNVTEPSLLPPPDELRDLPVEALLRALASTRPLHESLPAAMRALASARSNGDVELDPLQRYSASGQLFQRTRRLSVALDGLRRRLERPASNIDALIWRLEGPFGPKVVAEGLLRDLKDAPGALPGEASFLIAELALTLSRVNWASTARILGKATVLPHVAKLLAEVCDLARQELPADARLAKYVKSALAEAKA
jgi:hypothetical protein